MIWNYSVAGPRRKKLAAAVGTVLGVTPKYLGITGTRIKTREDRVAFPWFNQVDENSTAAYTHFISALCEMSRNATEKAVGKEKYAFRCFLLWLGFIGAEYKAERKILLRNLTGNSSFRSGQPKEVGQLG